MDRTTISIVHRRERASMRVYTGGVEEPKTDPDIVPVAERTAGTPTTTTRSKVEAAGRLPSIEMEPKTLTLDQIKYAREAALYVVSTKTEEEAVRIFTAGLKPVQASATPTTVRNNNKSGSVDSSDDDVDLGGAFDSRSHAGGKGGRRGRRSASASLMDDVRDVVTAPF